MIYGSIKDGELKGIVLSCSCGCSMIEFKVLWDEMFISAFSSDWYTHQGAGTLAKDIKYVKDSMGGKKVILCDVIIDREEMERFLSMVKELKFKPVVEGTPESFTNTSHVSLECIHVSGNSSQDDFSVQIRSDNAGIDLALEKHTGYEIRMSKGDWDALIHKMEKYVEYTKSGREEE